jgi:3-phosphoshikimate 1-carboxyvinyltransferase
VLSIVATAAEGRTEFTHAARLRLKESDRLSSTANLIRDLGGDVSERPDGLVVEGSSLVGGAVDVCNDHRLVMAASLAATRCSAPVTFEGAEAIEKSYPSFFEDYRMLGGEADVI